MSGPAQSATSSTPAKAQRDRARQIDDVWQWLGISGDAVGADGILRRTFFYAYGVAVALVAVFNTINVITIQHGMPHLGLLKPVIAEGSSWLSFVIVFPLGWIGYRLAPPNVRPRWWLAVHIPGMVIQSLAHVAIFVALRKLAFAALGDHYDFGPVGPTFLYEFRKDVFGYALFIAGCTLVEHLLRQQQLIHTPGQTLTFDIRDGAKLTRVRLSDILAITSAGNYVEFILADGRRPLARRSLSAVESDLAGRGFVRTHRSWLVNEKAVTGLQPEGSGDYGVALGSLTAPLSRRFPAALARLRAGA